MRFNLFTLLFVLCSANSFAQPSTNSPYSSYGFGEKNGNEHAIFTGLGNSTISYFDSTVLNLYNPATYNTLGQGQPLFSLGINARLSFYEQNGVEQFKATTQVDHFAMAFTLKKHFGLAFGIKPYAKKGYSMTERIAVGEDSVLYSYLGTGGINQAFIGLSSNIIKLKNTTLSVGSNLSYLFGTSTNERRSQLIDPNNSDGGVDWHSTKITSFHYDIGAYFRQTLKQNHHFTVAAVIEPGQKLKATTDEYLFYGEIGDPNDYNDTLFSLVDQRGTINMPMISTLGFNYNFWFNDAKKNNTMRNSELALHINYSSTDWTKFSTSFNATPSTLLSANRFSVGIQYIPERKFIENAVSSKFLEKIRYRIGFYQSMLPYSFGGEQLQDMGATIGFGIPILAQNSLSSINFGFAYGNRGTAVANSFNEQYVGINFGIILAPSNFDRWFRKKKLD